MDTSKETPQKAVYTKPAVTRIGSFEEVTLGNSTGGFLDAGFPAGTPRGDLTFS